MEEDDGHLENGIHAAKDSDRQQRLRLCVLNEILNTEKDYVRTLVFLQSVSLACFMQACGRVPLSHTRANVVNTKLWPPFIQFNCVPSLANLRLGGMTQLVTFYNPRLHIHVRHSECISFPSSVPQFNLNILPCCNWLVGYGDKPPVFRIGSRHPRERSLFFSTLWSRVVKHKQALFVARCCLLHTHTRANLHWGGTACWRCSRVCTCDKTAASSPGVTRESVRVM